MIKKANGLKLVIKIIIAFFILGYIIFPLSKLITVSFSQSEAVRGLLRPQLAVAVFNSLILSFISVAGSAVIGTYFAYCLNYKSIWLKNIFSTIILLPIAIPPIVGVMAYLFLLSDNGILMRLTGIKHFDFSGWPAIIIIHLYSFYPLTYLFINNFLKTIDNSTIEVARVLGAKKIKIFYSILLPQLKTPLLAAGLLTFMASMASFSAPFIFGGSQRFLTTEIYYAKINGDVPFSALLSLLLAFISLLCLVFFKIYNKKIPQAAATKGVTKKNLSGKRTGFDVLHTILVVVFTAIIILPILSLLIISLVPQNEIMETGMFSHFSLDNYGNIFSDTDLFNPFSNSISAALLAVIITIFAGIAVAHTTRRRKNIFNSFLDTSALIPYGIPGTVLAVCMILSFNGPNVFSLYTILVGTFWILPIVYGVRNLPIAVQAVRTGLHSIDRSAEEASTTMGAAYFQTWRFITLPLLLPSILDATMLVFINAFGEFVATVLLYTYSSKTIPIEVYAQVREYNNGAAAADGVLIFIIVLSVIAFIKIANNRIHLKRNNAVNT